MSPLACCNAVSGQIVWRILRIHSTYIPFSISCWFNFCIARIWFILRNCWRFLAPSNVCCRLPELFLLLAIRHCGPLFRLASHVARRVPPSAGHLAERHQQGKLSTQQNKTSSHEKACHLAIEIYLVSLGRSGSLRRQLHISHLPQTNLGILDKAT